MKLNRILRSAALAVAFTFAVATAQADVSCCVKANAEGKRCEHKCCADARKAEKLCEKCQAKASCCDKALAKGKTCEHKCCADATKAKKVCEKCNPKAEEKKPAQLELLTATRSLTPTPEGRQGQPFVPQRGCPAVPEPRRTIYFDCNATTPLDSSVREAMLPFLGPVYGNPSSLHRLGREARACLDEARERAAAVLSCKPSESVFTSGGTESNNLALFGAAHRLRAKGRHLITSRVEHHAVLNCFQTLASDEGFELSWLEVDAQARVDPGQLRALLRNDTVLVSVMAANNEIGTLQDVAEIGTICRESGVVFHTDAVQWFGKEPVSGIQQFEADLVSICAHKFYGPKGAGLLYVRAPLQPQPLLRGATQENDRRPGTENLAAIVGLVCALELFVSPPVFPQPQLRELTARLESGIARIEGSRIHASSARRLANTVGVTIEGTDSLSLLAGLDLEGVCASAGAACSSGALVPSHVIAALGFPENVARSFLRFSLGRESTVQDVERVVEVLRDVVDRVRTSSVPV